MRNEPFRVARLQERSRGARARSVLGNVCKELRQYERGDLDTVEAADLRDRVREYRDELMALPQYRPILEDLLGDNFNPMED
jgi:hypothetical protein